VEGAEEAGVGAEDGPDGVETMESDDVRKAFLEGISLENLTLEGRHNSVVDDRN
jgi:hypothetical protein